MNVLLTSISGKVPLIKRVKKALTRINSNGLLFGGDSNQDIIGKYFVDQFWKMPKLKELDIKLFVDFCQSNKITRIIPTRNDDLVFLGQYQSYLLECDIHLLLSNYLPLQNVLDKLVFYEHGIKMGYPLIHTSNNIDQINTEKYVIKDRYGSGSQNIAINVAKDKAISHARKIKKPIFQPFIDGEEYSIDVYVDRSGKSKGSIVRKRDLVINGESQVTTTVQKKELECLAQKMAEDFQLYGHVMFQVIIDQKGHFHIIECNPRFGGASTLSVDAGLDSFYWFFLECEGENLLNYPFNRNEKELKLIRHSEDLII
ncbi:carbamoyl phosphate synthase [Heyndrickxia sporothermodurans]|nr:carbamoyl phosphate synthase [Heyndrickxia sporothermodurans]